MPVHPGAELVFVAVVWNAALVAVTALLHLGWRPRQRLVVLLIAAPVLSLAAILATDEVLAAAVATIVAVVLVGVLMHRREQRTATEQPW